jgi:hypothetical protein
MKNKKIYISMLVLAISFLVAMYVLKIFFPQEFMLAIQNERIIMVGEFINSHLWLRYICYLVTSFFTYWLFCCACCHKLKLKWNECLYILIAIICIAVVELFDFNISTHLSIASFLVLPALMGGDLKTTAVVYSIHGIAQCLMLGIRNLPMYLVSVNYLTIFFVGIETYLWLILFYIIFNYKKENT